MHIQYPVPAPTWLLVNLKLQYSSSGLGADRGYGTFPLLVTVGLLNCHSKKRGYEIEFMRVFGVDKWESWWIGEVNEGRSEGGRKA